MKIIVNGKTEELPEGIHALSYENILAMAGYSPERVLTVAYSKQVRDGFKDGTVTRGEAVTTADGMIISVADTSNA